MSNIPVEFNEYFEDELCIACGEPEPGGVCECHGHCSLCGCDNDTFEDEIERTEASFEDFFSGAYECGLARRDAEEGEW